MLVSALDNLSVVLAAQAKYKEAQPLYERSLALREKATVENLNNLAMVMEATGDDAGAERQYNRAISLAEKIPATPWPGRWAKRKSSPRC